MKNNSKFENEVRHFANKNGYKVISISYEDVFNEMKSTIIELNMPYRYETPALRKKAFLFEQKMFKKYHIYVSFN